MFSIRLFRKVPDPEDLRSINSIDSSRRICFPPFYRILLHAKVQDGNGFCKIFMFAIRQFSFFDNLNLKGLSREMDLDFDDMYSYF